MTLFYILEHSFSKSVIVLVPLLVAIVKLGVHLPTVLRGLIFYIQISPIAVEFLPQSFKLKVDIVSSMPTISAINSCTQLIITGVIHWKCIGSLHAI